MAETCSYCGEKGHSIQNCPKWKGGEVATATKPEICNFLMNRMQELLKEMEKEPSRATERMKALVKTLKIAKDRVFDEHGTLIDKTELLDRLRRIYEIHYNNALIWSHRMEEIIKVGEWLECRNLPQMNKIHDVDGLAIFRKFLATPYLNEKALETLIAEE